MQNKYPKYRNRIGFKTYKLNSENRQNQLNKTILNFQATNKFTRKQLQVRNIKI